MIENSKDGDMHHLIYCITLTPKISCKSFSGVEIGFILNSSTIIKNFWKITDST